MFEITNKSAVISSVDLVKMINAYRKEEHDLKAKRQADNGEVITAKYTELKHNDFRKSIRTELETMELLGLEDVGNFSQMSYLDSYGRTQPCYYMTRGGTKLHHL